MPGTLLVQHGRARPFERKALANRVHTHGHDRTRQPSRQTRARRETVRFLRPPTDAGSSAKNVCSPLRISSWNFPARVSGPRLATTPCRNLDLRKIRLEKWEESACPGGHYSRGVVRICGTRKQVICCVEREEALGVFGCDEDARRVVNADHLIQRRMHHQHRTSERGLMDFFKSENLNRPLARKLRRTRKVRPAISADRFALACDGVQVDGPEEPPEYARGRRARRSSPRPPRQATGPRPTIAAVPPGLYQQAKKAASPPPSSPLRLNGIASTSDAKLTGSPDPAPIPAKSNPRTPMPARDSAREM